MILNINDTEHLVAFCQYAGSFYAECCYAGCLYTECHCTARNSFIMYVFTKATKSFPWVISWNTNRMGRLSTVDLPIKLACFVKKVNNIFNIKSNSTKLVSTGGQLY